MQIGVVGKTGSGKTTVVALIALVAASRGRRVVAVDTDDPPNLVMSLGLGAAATERSPVVPRALARGRGGGAVTPSQLLAGFGIGTPGGVTVLHALRASDEAAGCGCAAHASDRSLLAEGLAEAGVAVVDLEAGLDHLDRHGGTLAHACALLVVVEPSRKSSLVAAHVVSRARAFGVEVAAMVGTKAAPGDEELLAGAAHDLGLPVAGVVPFSQEIADADRAGEGLTVPAGPVRAAVEGVLDVLGSRRGAPGPA